MCCGRRPEGHAPAEAVTDHADPAGHLGCGAQGVQRGRDVCGGLVPVELLRGGDALLHVAGAGAVELEFALAKVQLGRVDHVAGGGEVGAALPDVAAHPEDLLNHQQARPGTRRRQPPFDRQGTASTQHVYEITHDAILPHRAKRRNRLVSEGPVCPLVLVGGRSYDG